MVRVMLSARVTETQAAALRSYAADVGLPYYQATVRALELGIAALVGGKTEAAMVPVVPPVELDALHDAVGDLLARSERTERLLQRTLFAAGAAYAAAMAAAGEGASPERVTAIKDEIVRDSQHIYDRQLAKAQAG